MRIAIVGTRGIPNHYGGFEQFADILSQGLVKKGHDITVYCSANHPYKEEDYNGVKLIHKYDPENKIGTAGQFIYDLACMLDARKRDFDIIYMLGYTSSSVWQRLIYKQNAVVITNMDGLEWKRSKYSHKVQQFLKYAERLAVKHSDLLVSDSLAIQSYLKNKYEAESTYIPYGSFVFKHSNKNSLTSFGLTAYDYDMLMARFEPENSIETILKAFSASNTKRQLLLVGNYNGTEFGKKMYEEYSTDDRIRFLGAIYDQEVLNNLRYFSNIYFHGHSVGGTNPSLLEAMGSSALLCIHDNEFNKAIVGEDGFTFSDAKGLTKIINEITKSSFAELIANNLKKIALIYSWPGITNRYEKYFMQALSILPVQQPVFQSRPIPVQTIGTLRNKPALAYMGPFSNGYTRKMMGPELVTIFKSPAQYSTTFNLTEQVTKSSHQLRSPEQYLVMKEMRNTPPLRPRHPFMGKANLLSDPELAPERTPELVTPRIQGNLLRIPRRLILLSR